MDDATDNESPDDEPRTPVDLDMPDNPDLATWTPPRGIIFRVIAILALLLALATVALMILAVVLGITQSAAS
ncbi:MAG: hypothetical protein IT440_02940 [Phycisphaeraceae bacterium]|nr:hypothetical protein [Phycisphaeraceae bacterium]